MDAGEYQGAYDTHSTTGPNGFGGQSLSMSTNSGAWGFFLSGARQQSDMRQEPVMFDTVNKRVVNLHNAGDDYFGFAKIQFTPGTHDVFSLELNASQTKFATPYDTTGGTFRRTITRTTRTASPTTLNWHHLFGDSSSRGQAPSELFTGLYVRHGGLDYLPGAGDTPQFIFFPDTLTPYNLTEHRSFTTYGLKFDYAFRPARELEFKVGTQSSLTTGHENFSTVAGNGSLGPASDSPLTGDDIGVYAQTSYSPTEWFELRTGARYDDHEAPLRGHPESAEPAHVRLNCFPSPATGVLNSCITAGGSSCPPTSRICGRSPARPRAAQPQCQRSPSATTSTRPGLRIGSQTRGSSPKSPTTIRTAALVSTTTPSLAPTS